MGSRSHTPVSRAQQIQRRSMGGESQQPSSEVECHLFLHRQLLGLRANSSTEFQGITALPPIPIHYKALPPLPVPSPKPTGPTVVRPGQQTDPASFNPLENPDGGTTAWLTVFGAFLTIFCSFGWINTMAIWQEYYARHQLAAYSPSAISWITSLGSFVLFFFGLPVGVLLDNYGPRWLIVSGSFLHVLGLMMASLATEYYQLVLAQGLCSPMGICLLFYPAIGVVPTWFTKRKSLAMGIVVSGSCLGGTILPIMVQKLLQEVGFAWTMRITAFFIWHLQTMAMFTVQSRIKKPRRTRVSMREMLSPLKEAPFALTALGVFLFTLGFWIPLNYLVVEAVYYGVRPALALYLVAVLNAVSLPARIIAGHAADHFGPFNVMIITCLSTSK
jgi:MFS family permease